WSRARRRRARSARPPATSPRRRRAPARCNARRIRRPRSPRAISPGTRRGSRRSPPCRPSTRLRAGTRARPEMRRPRSCRTSSARRLARARSACSPPRLVRRNADDPSRRRRRSGPRAGRGRCPRRARWRRRGRGRRSRGAFEWAPSGGEGHSNALFRSSRTAAVRPAERRFPVSCRPRSPGGKPMGFTTKQVHAGVTPDPVSGAILTPVYQSTTFVQESVDQYLAKGYSYSRSGNPTVRALERKLAALEGGVDCTCYATGMATEQAVLQATLSAGDHAVVSDVAYGGTYRLCTKIYSRYGVQFTFVDKSNPEAVRAALKPNTKLVFTE